MRARVMETMARRGFDAYAALVDSTTAEFYDGATEGRFDPAEYDRAYYGKRYWKVCHWTQGPHDQAPRLQRTVDVDNAGIIVRPLGCMWWLVNGLAAGNPTGPYADGVEVARYEH